MKVIALLSVAVALMACASKRTSGPASSIETTRVSNGQLSQSITRVNTVAPGVITLPASFDRVWALLPAVYDTLGIPVSVNDPSKALFGNSSFKIRRKLGPVPLPKYIDCGRTQGVPSAETYEVNLVVLTQLQPAPDGGTTASTAIQAAARPISFAGEYSTCTSTSFLERRVGELLNDMLQR